MKKVLLPLIAAFALIGIISLLLLPIRIPYSIQALGRIMPAKEWILSRGEDGGLMATLYDHILGTMRAYSVAQFGRGDTIEFTLHSSIVPGAFVAIGDTVGLIHSNDPAMERQLTRLTGALSTERALLGLYRAGEKESVVREAQQRLTYAKQRAEEQRKIMERQHTLYERDLISQEEFEMAESTSKLYDIDVAIAEAELQTVQTGANKEQMDLVHSRIRALEDEIEMVRKTLENYTLTAPLSGLVFRSFSGDTLVAIGATAYVVVMLVKWKDRPYLAPNQDVQLNVSGLNSSPRGTLMQLGNSVRVLNGEQVLLAAALVKPNAEGLVPGLIARCSISCEPATPLEYLGRVVKSIFVQ